MRKLLVLIISIIILFNIVPIAVSYAESELSTQQALVCGLGLMDYDADGSFNGEKKLSRGELANVIASIFLQENDSSAAWREQYFKDLEDELNVDESSMEAADDEFIDVQPGSEYYESVSYLKSMGIMVGLDENVFGVDSSTTIQQIAKVMVSILGYSVQAKNEGGFPQGYMNVANRIGVLKGVTNTAEVTKNDLAKILYNCLDIPVLKQTFNLETYYRDKEDTFMTYILGIHEYDGILNDNGYYSLDGYSRVKAGSIKVGDIVVDASKYSNCISNIGRNVKIWYEEEDDNYILKYILLDEEENITTINARDFISFEVTNSTSGVITYEIDGKKKTQRILPQATCIINGQPVSSFSDEDFTFEAGDIQIIETGESSAADLIIINKYYSLYVIGVDSENRIIYGKNLFDENNSMIDCSENKYEKLNIYSDNKELEFSDIAVGNVISIKPSERIADIYVSTKTISGFSVTNIMMEDNTVSDGVQEFLMSKEFLNFENSILLGKSYTLYLDIFDRILFAEAMQESDSTVACLIKTRYIEEENIVRVEYIDESGITNSALCADKVRILNSDNSKITYKDPIDIKTAIDNANEDVFIYTMNDEGKIDYIEFACKQSILGNENGRLQKIVLPDYTWTQWGGWYKKIHVGIGGAIAENLNATVFLINPDYIHQTEGYNVGYYKDVFAADGYYDNIAGYTTIADSQVPQYLTYQTEAGVSSIAYENKDFVVVLSIENSVDIDNMPTTYINAYKPNSGNIRLEIKDEAKSQITDMSRSGKTYTLGKGDIFRYSIGSDGTISAVEILYDANGGWMEKDENGKYFDVEEGSGAIPHNIGYYDANNLELSNPLCRANSEDGYTGEDPRYWRTDSRRYMYGSIIKNSGSAVTVTTQNLRNSDFIDTNFDKYCINTWNLIASPVLITYDHGDVTAKTISSSSFSNELRSFENFGRECDNIIMVSGAGSVEFTAIIRNLDR